MLLCRNFKNVLITNPANNVIIRPDRTIQARPYSKWFDVMSGTKMAPSYRLKVFSDLLRNRILKGWTKSYIANSVYKRWKADQGTKKMLMYFRQVFFRPRTQLLVSATATINRNTEEKPGPPKKCSRNIKDKEMKKLIKDLDRVDDLSKATLFCEGCDKRIVIDSKHKGIQYCECPNSTPPAGIYDGWVPYMESEDVIIWRKEYKPGGLYAYKVYGRYKHIKAEDFAMIQVDGSYRKVWDSAVASLSVVEREANGKKDQCVLHWEVLWPRLFANRDYVYLRRHKEFDVQSKCLVHKDGLFPDTERCKPDTAVDSRNVHAKAKRMSLEMEEKERKAKENAGEGAKDLKHNKVYVIVSRSCTHPDAPETSKAIRVMEYWSHMVITTLNGPDRPGMEFVLTYYDEPAVGGLPTAVTSWAMGRAGPAFLQRMRRAAQEYNAWKTLHPQETPDFMPFAATNVSYEIEDILSNEEDMETAKVGPDIEEDEDFPLDTEEKEEKLEERDQKGTCDDSTQTRPAIVTPIDDDPQDGPRLVAEATTPIPYKLNEPQVEDLMPNSGKNNVELPSKDEEIASNKYQIKQTTSPPQDVRESSNEHVRGTREECSAPERVYGSSGALPSSRVPPAPHDCSVDVFDCDKIKSATTERCE